MNNTCTFTDLSGTEWVLTALRLNGSSVVLESGCAERICVMARHVSLVVSDDVNSPFALVLDHDTTIAVDTPTKNNLRLFLEGANHGAIQ